MIFSREQRFQTARGVGIIGSNSRVFTPSRNHFTILIFSWIFKKPIIEMNEVLTGDIPIFVIFFVKIYSKPFSNFCVLLAIVWSIPKRTDFKKHHAITANIIFYCEFVRWQNSLRRPPTAAAAFRIMKDIKKIEKQILLEK